MDLKLKYPRMMQLQTFRWPTSAFASQVNRQTCALARPLVLCSVCSEMLV